MDPKRRFLPERAADKDFGIAWVKRYGRGRVFYNALGHTPEVFQDPKLLQHFLAGIQYALGDLKADDTPSAKLKKR
jgi:type 1 glutamine amidotransferase